jgi:WD40 repeat protein
VNNSEKKWDKNTSQEYNPLESTSFVIGLHRNSEIIDLAFYPNNKNSDVNSSSSFLFVITNKGILIHLDVSTFRMERWQQFPADIFLYSLSVNSNYIAVGCSNGVVRFFNPQTLNNITTLPQPVPFGVNDLKKYVLGRCSEQNYSYPTAQCIRLTSNTNGNITVLYGDRSLFVWDATETPSVGNALAVVSYSLRKVIFAHSSCIYAIESFPSINIDAVWADYVQDWLYIYIS